MLAKQYRLPSFEKFPSSRSATTEYFRILRKSNSVPYNRFGFVISKKVDARAVVRNRLRRVLSEAVKDFLTATSGQDILIIVTKSFVNEPKDTIQAIIASLVKETI